MWSRPAISAMQRGLATCRKHEPMLERLEQMAKYAPTFAEQIREMRVLCDNLRHLAETGLAIDANSPAQHGE